MARGAAEPWLLKGTTPMKTAVLRAFALISLVVAVGCSGTDYLQGGSGDDGGTAAFDSTQGSGLQAIATQDFGTVQVGQRGDPVFIVVKNTASAASGALKTVLAGNDVESFFVDTDGCGGAPLEAAAQCTIAMRFAPASMGTKAATLIVRDD